MRKMKTQCPVCSAPQASVFFRWKQAPVKQQFVMPSRREALRCRRGDIELGFCNKCGLIWNTAFNSRLLDYSAAYDATQMISPSFRRYASDIAAYLVREHHLRSKKIIEIGCGDGTFLRYLCELGNNIGTGFDPSWKGGAYENNPENIRIIPDRYSDRYADHHADFICCRHVLEHIPDPVSFLRDLGDLTAVSAPVFFFEVPNVSWSLRRSAFWDIYYEHHSYYSSVSFKHLFSSCGFRVLKVRNGFGGQYIWLEALFTPGRAARNSDSSSSRELLKLHTDVKSFSANCQQVAEHARQIIHTLTADRKVAVWGAGAKAVALLNFLNIMPDQIEFVVDINPRKWGAYIPGTAQRIVPPASLGEVKPDVILVMNPAYLSEIRETMKEIGIKAKVWSIERKGGVV
jgi:SAM-dependent methyltransferase